MRLEAITVPHFITFSVFWSLYVLLRATKATKAKHAFSGEILRFVLTANAGTSMNACRGNSKTYIWHFSMPVLELWA